MEELTEAIAGLGLGISVKEKVPLDKIRNEVMKHETCEAWQAALSVSPEELQIALETIEGTFEDFANRKDENETDLHYSAVETVTKRITQAYILTTQKRTDEAESVLAEAESLIKYCVKMRYFSEDYADGFRWIVRSLEFSVAIETESEGWEEEKVEKCLAHLKSFEKLSKKNQVGVLAVKQYFFGTLCHTAYDLQESTIKEMVKADPKNPEWWLCLHLVHRFRREAVNKYGAIGKDEEDSISEAMKSPGGDKDPRVLMGYLTCLADRFKNACRDRSFQPFSFGSRRFSSDHEVYRFIRSEADRILAIDPMSVRSNVNIAKIFSSVLPRPFQDKDFARTCLKRALLFHPNSSKANHRMGVLFLQSGDHVKALKYLMRAFETDKRNFYAAMDVLSILLADVSKNSAKLMELFSIALTREYFKKSPKKNARLHMMAGVHEYLRGESTEALDYFIKAHKDDSGDAVEFFKDFGRNASRFSWESNTRGSNLLGGIRNLLHTEYSRCSDPLRKRILSQLYEAASTGSSSSGRRGGRTNFGSSSRGGHSRSNFSGSGFYRNFGGGDYSNFFGGDRSNEDHRKSRTTTTAPDCPYAILGLQVGAAKAEIKKAYYAKAKEYHPDKNRDLPEGELLQKQEEMKRINKAWETLQAKGQ